ncbi:FlgD immunoglobulin-like domain containing protein [Patescibacteria group bacterium]
MYLSKALTLKRVGTVAVLVIFAFTLMVAQALSTQASTPAISNFSVNPSTFNPNSQSTSIEFNVNQPGKVGVEIHEGTEQVKVLALRDDVTSGPQTYTWDGTDRNGIKVGNGNYIVRVIYFGDTFTLFKTGSLTVNYSVNPDPDPDPDPTVDLIQNDYVTPTSFDPTQQNVKIYFTLTEDVEDLDFSIYNVNDELVLEMINSQSTTSGAKYVKWNGRNSIYDLVPAGTYKYKINASNSNGSDYAEGTFILYYENQPSTGDAPDIVNDYASPSTFDPTTETTDIEFTLNTDASVSVKVYEGSTLVKTLLSDGSLSNQSYSYTWNGTDNNGVIVQSGVYTYKITANNAYGSDLETGSILADYTPGNVLDVPNITNGYASPDTIDPHQGEIMNIHYTLNTCAYVQVKVYDPSDNDAYVTTLQQYNFECEGSRSVVWDGTNSNGVIVHNGDYKIVITANNTEGDDEEVEFVEIRDDNGGGSGNGPDVYGLSTNRDPFDPSDGETTTLTYSTDGCADVYVKVYDDNDNLVVNLLDGPHRCEGTYSSTWDGEDSSNDEVDDGTYYFKVYASNNDGSDSEREYVEVDTDGSGGGGDGDEVPRITDVDVNPSRFNPYDEEAELEFELNTCADVTIEVRDDDGDLVYEILDDRWLCEGDYDYEWDGEDEDNDYVREDDYEFYIRARNDEGSDTERADVEVDYDGYSFNNNERCSAYYDVSINDPYCEAIEYVSNAGIFDGYPDGTFKPYQAINRAETSKVIIKGFDYPILSPDGTNLGFWDLLPEAWYISYIKTGKAYGILQGYPDGSFQPARTVNRVELLKIFLESANVSLPHCSTSPYVDTPIKADTEWYIPYVCYAKMNNLMDTDYYGHFNPAKPMTRGDVAELFYRFANRGLYVGSNYSDNYYNDNYYNDNYYNDDYNYGTSAQLSSVELSEDEVEEGESLTIYYTLNARSNVTVEILDDDGDTVRELTDDLSQSQGRHSIYFNGEDDDGDDLREGDEYTVMVVARNYYGSDKEEIDFDVVEDSGNDDDYRDEGKLVDVYDLEVNPDEFDPDNETTDIKFRLSRTAEITVKVYDDDNDLVLRLVDEEDLRGGTHVVEWDGEDRDGDELDDGQYTIVIQAESTLGDDEEEIVVEINH